MQWLAPQKKININTYESKAGEVSKNENTELHQKQTRIRQYLYTVLLSLSTCYGAEIILKSYKFLRSFNELSALS